MNIIFDTQICKQEIYKQWHMSGINQDLEKEIRDEALEFKKKCSCQPNPWKKGLSQQ